MFSVKYSTREKPILKILVMKRKPKSREKNLLSMLFLSLFHVFVWINEPRQLCIVTSRSTDIPKLFKRDHILLSAASFVSYHQIEFPICLWSECCCFLCSGQIKHLSVGKKTKKNCKKNLLEAASDQTSVLADQTMQSGDGVLILLTSC